MRRVSKLSGAKADAESPTESSGGWWSRNWRTILLWALVILTLLAFFSAKASFNRKAEAEVRAVEEQTRVIREYGMRFNPQTDTIINVTVEGTRYITPPPGRNIRWHVVDSVSFEATFRNVEGDTATIEVPREFTGCVLAPFPFRFVRFRAKEAGQLRLIQQVLPDGENLPSDCVERRNQARAS